MPFPDRLVEPLLSGANEAHALYGRVVGVGQQRRSRLTVEGALAEVEERLPPPAHSPAAATAAAAITRDAGSSTAASDTQAAGAGTHGLGSPAQAEGGGSAVRGSGSSGAVGAGDSALAALATAAASGGPDPRLLNPLRVLRLKLLIEQAALAALEGDGGQACRVQVLRLLCRAAEAAVAMLRAAPCNVALRLLAELLQLIAGCSGPAWHACFAGWQFWVDAPSRLDWCEELPHPVMEVGRQQGQAGGCRLLPPLAGAGAAAVALR